MHRSEDAEFYRLLASELKLMLPDVSSRSIIDIGCGAGELYSDLEFDKARRYTGVDISGRMLYEFRAKVPGVDLMCCPAETYLGTEKSDLVFCNAVAQYLNREKLNALMRNASQMLEVRGYIFLGLIPWAPFKLTYYAGDVAPAGLSGPSRVIRAGKSLVRDRIGYWYTWSALRRMAEKHNLDPFFFGSVTDPYRFHVLLTRLSDFDGGPDDTLRRLLSSRRS